MEVMMVSLAGDFVARRLPRQFHRHQGAFFKKRIDGSVHGGDADPRHLAAHLREDFLGAQRASVRGEDFPDGLPLARVSLHINSLLDIEVFVSRAC
jgi:hypothetical protein